MVIITGAGLAGLAYALALVRSGKGGLVLEASDLKSPMLVYVFKSYTGF